MKVKIKEDTRFAISPAKVIDLKIGEVYEVGKNGVTETNLKRMLELGIAANLSDFIKKPELKKNNKVNGKEDGSSKNKKVSEKESGKIKKIFKKRGKK